MTTTWLRSIGYSHSDIEEHHLMVDPAGNAILIDWDKAEGMRVLEERKDPSGKHTRLSCL